MKYEDIDPRLMLLVDKNERILWFGKPNQLCFVLGIAFSILLPIAVVFGVIGISIITALIIDSKKNISQVIVPIGMILLWLLPLWGYLWTCLTAFIRHRNTSYIITNEAIYISDGVIFKSFTRNPISEVVSPKIRVGKLDKLMGVGDVINYTYNAFNKPKYNNTQEIVFEDKKVKVRASNDPSLCAIKDYKEVYEIIRNLQYEKNGPNNYMQDSYTQNSEPEIYTIK